MNRILLSGAGLLALAIAAQPVTAADLPAPVTKAPPVAAPIFNWSGFYVGAQAGYAWVDSARHEFIGAGVTSDRLRPEGFVGGATAGINWHHGAWNFGIEGDISHADLNDTDRAADPSGCNTADCISKVNWFATLRGRAGPAFGNLFPYVTAGAAVGETQILARPTSAFYDHSETNWGWTAGAGVEAALGGGWTGKVEYLYVDLGENHDRPNFVEAEFQFHVVRVGLNYRFATGKAPVVTRY